MAKHTEELWKTLQELKDYEFKNFTWFLKQDDILKDFSGIPAAQLEKAERQDTVDLMVHKYQGPGALLMTVKVLEKINRNDLAEHLQNSSPEPKDLRPHDAGPLKEEYDRRPAELKSIQQFAVDVTLDPDTAHCKLILSDDGKQVNHGDVKKNLPDNPERFSYCVNVLAKQSFSSGRFYFEVQVKGKTDWDLGVARESINRKGQITLSPQKGYWTIWLRNGNEYKALAGPDVRLSLKSPPQKVGVFVDYEEGLVSFYDVDAAALIYSFTGCSFTEKLYPFFSPHPNNGGRNSAALIISPIDHTN